MPTAAVRLRDEDGTEHQDAALGDGPIDAVFKAIERITGFHGKLCDYSVRSVTVGKDAQGEVSIEVKHDGRTHRGRGLSTDIIEASAKAFLDVVNRVPVKERKDETIPV